MKREHVTDIVGIILCGLGVLFEIIDEIISLVTGRVPNTATTACTIFLLCGVIISLLFVHAAELKIHWSDEKGEENGSDCDK